MSTIIIRDASALKDAIEFADQAECTDRFARDLVNFLRTLTVGMTKDCNRVAEVYKDFAPHSFSFGIFDNVRVECPGRERSNLRLNGGWIYAGPGAPGDGSFPSLTVNLSYVTGQAPVHSWSVHT